LWRGSWDWSRRYGDPFEMRFFMEGAMLWILGGFFRILPRKADLYLGRVIGRSAYHLAPGRKKLTLANLRNSLGGELDEGQIRKIAVSSFESLGMNAVEFFKLPRLNPGNVGLYTSLEGQDHLEDALGMGRGVLLLSGHIGNWDMLSAGVSLRGYRLALITKISRSEALNRIWMGYRRKLGIGIFMGRGTMRESMRHLKNGGIVGCVLDQNARRKEGVFVPFFGRQASTITNLALLARRTGAPVVPLYTYRDGDIHRIVIEKPMLHDKLDDAEEDVLERTAAYTQWIEKVVRLYPQQWTWLHNRWRTRPKGELM